MANVSGVLGQAALTKGKSRQKTKKLGTLGGVKTGSQVAGGIARGRSGRPHGVKRAEFDQFGLATDSKYANLGVRCRENVTKALLAGASYQQNSGTTEELVIFGELLRRGFLTPLGAAPRSFRWQSPIAGSIVDFEVWDQGAKIALRPQNQYWHGHLDKINADEKKAEQIERAGYVVYDIWSGDTLVDASLEHKMSQFFGDR